MRKVKLLITVTTIAAASTACKSKVDTSAAKSGPSCAASNGQQMSQASQALDKVMAQERLLGELAYAMALPLDTVSTYLLDNSITSTMFADNSFGGGDFNGGDQPMFALDGDNAPGGAGAVRPGDAPTGVTQYTQEGYNAAKEKPAVAIVRKEVEDNIKNLEQAAKNVVAQQEAVKLIIEEQNAKIKEGAASDAVELKRLQDAYEAAKKKLDDDLAAQKARIEELSKARKSAADLVIKKESSSLGPVNQGLTDVLASIKGQREYLQSQLAFLKAAGCIIQHDGFNKALEGTYPRPEALQSATSPLRPEPLPGNDQQDAWMKAVFKPGTYILGTEKGQNWFQWKVEISYGNKAILKFRWLATTDLDDKKLPKPDAKWIETVTYSLKCDHEKKACVENAPDVGDTSQLTPYTLTAVEGQAVATYLLKYTSSDDTGGVKPWSLYVRPIGATGQAGQQPQQPVQQQQQPQQQGYQQQPQQQQGYQQR
jgi:hypothetical protein